MKTHISQLFTPMIVLIFGVIGISSGSILVRLAQGQDMPSIVVAAWRMTLAASILLPLALTRRRSELKQMSGISWGLAILCGFMLALLIFQEIPNGSTIVGSIILLAGIVYANRPAHL